MCDTRLPRLAALLEGVKHPMPPKRGPMNRPLQSSPAITCLLLLLSILAGCKPTTPNTIPSDLLVALERGPCFGTCPVYSLTISADGSVRFDGMQFVEAQGERTASITREQLQVLVDAILSADFFALQDSYIVSATDLPSITTTVTLEGRTNSIYHYGVGCGTDLDTAPPQLCEIEALLEGIPVSNGWVSGG